MSHWSLVTGVFYFGSMPGAGMFYCSKCDIPSMTISQPMEGVAMELADLKVYQLSMEIGERVWSLVMPWDYFATDTSKPLVEAPGCKKAALPSS